MPEEVRELYIDLMTRAVTDSIFIDHPLADYTVGEVPTWSAKRRFAYRALSAIAEKAGFRIVRQTQRINPLESVSEARAGGREWPARAHTMIGLKRLQNLKNCVQTVIDDDVPGDFIETGVWRGGSCIFMRAMLKAYGIRDRRVWVADSFEGLPKPDPRFDADKGDTFHIYSDLAISREQVAANFASYGLLDDQVQFLKGWFKDTLPSAPIERLAIIRLDGDMYESTIQAIEPLYDKLSVGGFVIVDDYFLEPCARAIHDFRAARGIKDEIIDIDGLGSYWRKSS